MGTRDSQSRKYPEVSASTKAHEENERTKGENELNVLNADKDSFQNRIAKGKLAV